MQSHLSYETALTVFDCGAMPGELIRGFALWFGTSRYSTAMIAAKELTSNVQIISNMEMSFKMRWPDALRSFAQVLSYPMELWRLRATFATYTTRCRSGTWAYLFVGTCP